MTTSTPLNAQEAPASSTSSSGPAAVGRYLMVVLGGALDGRNYVVTARDMTDSERRVFRRKAR